MVPATFLGAGQKKETSLVQISQFLKSFKITTRKFVTSLVQQVPLCFSWYPVPQIQSVWNGGFRPALDGGSSLEM